MLSIGPSQVRLNTIIRKRDGRGGMVRIQSVSCSSVQATGGLQEHFMEESAPNKPDLLNLLKTDRGLVIGQQAPAGQGAGDGIRKRN